MWWILAFLFLGLTILGNSLQYIYPSMAFPLIFPIAVCAIASIACGTVGFRKDLR